MTEQNTSDNQYMLPSGELATLERPDMWTILSQVGNIPDILTSKVLRLLELEGISLPEGSSSTWKLLADKQLGMFGIYAWCRKDKKLDLKIEHGNGVDTLGRLDVLPIDLEYVYYNFFRAGNARKFSTYSNTADVRRATELTSDMLGLFNNPIEIPTTDNGVLANSD